MNQEKTLQNVISKRTMECAFAKVYRNLILSMPNQIQAVIAANGGNTKYTVKVDITVR